MTLNEHDKVLLVALRKGNHFKANPGDVAELLGNELGNTGPSDGLSSARRLRENGFVKYVQDSNTPGKTLLRMTDNGIALADNLIEERRTPSRWEQFKGLPFGTGLWDIVKIGLGFGLGLLTAHLTEG